MKEYIKTLVEDKTTSQKRIVERLLKMYNDAPDKVVEKGLYEVTESDYGGVYDISKFTVEITEKIAFRDLILKLYEKNGYISSWPYLTIRPYIPKANIII